MKRRAALLKGVNVGGNRKLPMADLRAFLEEAGYGDPKTLLASGNVAFDAEGTAAKLEKELAAAARKALNLDTEWLIRDAAELDAVIAANPFADAAKDRPSHLLVVFHREPFDAALLKRLDEYDGPERLKAVGRELFIDYPDGIGRSQLNPAMAKAKFPKLATARNWNTVRKLRDML